MRPALLLIAQVLANLALWVPLPLGVLWAASQLEYHTGSLMLGVVAAFALLFAGISVGMRVVRRIDAAWRADGHGSDGALARIATACALIGGGGFAFWLLIIGGLSSSIFVPNK